MQLSGFQFAKLYHYITEQMQNYGETMQPSIKEVIKSLKYQK